MTEKLKPCHCGKEPILHPHQIPGYAVTCPCGLCTVPFATREETIACWNTRPEEDRLRAIVEAQREAIQVATAGWEHLWQLFCKRTVGEKITQEDKADDKELKNILLRCRSKLAKLEDAG